MSINLDLNSFKEPRLRKIFSYLYMVTIMLLPFMNAAWYLPVEKSLEKSVSYSQLLVAENLELRTTFFLNKINDSIVNTAQLVATEVDEIKINETLTYLLETNPSLLQVFYFDEQGVEKIEVERFFQSSQKKAQHLEDFNETANFISRSLEGEHITSDVHIIGNNIPIVDIYVPITINGKIMGVIKGVADISEIKTDFHNINKDGMQAYLFDSRGLVMVHTNYYLGLDNIDAFDRKVVAQVLGGEKADGLSKETRYINEAGDKVLAVGVPFENGWGVVVELNEEIAFSEIKFIRNIAILITMFMFPFALYVVTSSNRVRKAQNNFKLALSEAQKLAVIVEKSFEAVMIVDVKDYKYVYVNPSWERITGWRGDEVIGRSDPSLLNSGKHSKEFFKNLWDTILAGDTFTGEMINKKKDGTLYVSEVMIIPIRDKKGPIAYFAEISRDITERKKESDELIAQSNELERANKLMIGRELKMIELKEKIRRLEEDVESRL